MEEKRIHTQKLHSTNRIESSDKDCLFNVIVIPGHKRSRGLYKKYMKKVSAVVFVVDSTDVGEDTLTDASEFMYDILVDSSLIQLKMSVHAVLLNVQITLIGCNSNYCNTNQLQCSSAQVR